MERHKCKLCSRTFGSGRALGGHMKAHLATLPLPPKPFTESVSLSNSSSSESEHEVEELKQEEKGLIYGLRENPKKSMKIADNTGSVVVQDRESETESKNPTRKRSKRNRKSSLNQNSMEPKKQRFMVSSTPPPPPPPTEPEPVSSVSDTSPEEDVAMCLVMLSRDKWRRRKNVVEEEESKGCNQEIDMIKIKIKAKRVRGKHVCENCGKAFRSSKALGSHRSVCYRRDEAKEGNVNNNKIFECPFCLKVFGSGQALGGHKRSHLIPSSSNSISTANANNANPSVSRILKESSIDLNLPAPPEDDDLSVLSDA